MQYVWGNSDAQSQETDLWSEEYSPYCVMLEDSSNLQRSIWDRRYLSALLHVPLFGPMLPRSVDKSNFAQPLTVLILLRACISWESAQLDYPSLGKRFPLLIERAINFSSDFRSLFIFLRLPSDQYLSTLRVNEPCLQLLSFHSYGGFWRKPTCWYPKCRKFTPMRSNGKLLPT